MLHQPFFIAQSNRSSTYQESIQKIQSMPTFIEDSVNWGIDASMGALGFFCVLILSVSLFKR